VKRRVQTTAIWVLIPLSGVPRATVEITVVAPTSRQPTPTLLPYPDALDVVVVHEAVMARINEARAEAGLPALLWDDTLQDVAEGRAGAIVKGAAYDEIDATEAESLGELVAELRACLDDRVTTPDDVAQVAFGHWLGEQELGEILLRRWQRIGVGLDWGCPTERGLVLVVLLAGGTVPKTG